MKFGGYRHLPTVPITRAGPGRLRVGWLRLGHGEVLPPSLESCKLGIFNREIGGGGDVG